MPVTRDKPVEILINCCFGGFSFSNKFDEELKKRHPELVDEDFMYKWKCRSDLRIINLFKELGTEKSSGPSAEIKLVTIPPYHNYEYFDYDGIEQLNSTPYDDPIINELVNALQTTNFDMSKLPDYVQQRIKTINIVSDENSDEDSIDMY